MLTRPTMTDVVISEIKLYHVISGTFCMVVAGIAAFGTAVGWLVSFWPCCSLNLS
jgi:hypothetical protein